MPHKAGFAADLPETRRRYVTLGADWFAWRAVSLKQCKLDQLFSAGTQTKSANSTTCTRVSVAIHPVRRTINVIAVGIDSVLLETRVGV